MKSFVTCVLVLVAGGALPAQSLPPDELDVPRPGRQRADLSDSDLSFRGIFNSDLPGIGRQYQLKLILHPHLGDLTKYDYLRTAVGVRYNLSSHLELSGETNTYFGTGLRDIGFFQEAGFVDARFGFKYRLGPVLLRGWDSGIGASYTFPFGDPPAQLTDGLEHFRPFVTFARPLANHPNWRVFWKLGADLVSPTDIIGRHEKNDLTDDATSVGGGLIWQRDHLHYTLETIYETTRLIGGTHDDVFTLRPGFLWEIRRPGDEPGRSHWLLGMALTLSEGPDGFEWGLGAKVRLDLDFKRAFRRARDALVHR